MRLSFPAKIAAVVSVIVGLGVMGIAYSSYHKSDLMLQEQAVKHLENDVQREKVRIKTIYKMMADDVLFMADSASVQGIIRAVAGGGYDDQENATDIIWQQRLAVMFQTVLKQRKEYLSLRLIGVAGAGREMVRVDKGAGHTTIITPEQLQVKGSNDYFSKTVTLAKGQIYISNINLNRENGIISRPFTPVIRVATPIIESDGTVFGIIVVNVDFNQVSKPLYSPPSNVFYLVTNAAGDYLVHPDPNKCFAFEFNRRYLIQQDYPLDDFFTPGENSPDIIELKIANGGMVLEKFHFDSGDAQRFLVFAAVASYDFLRSNSHSLLKRLLLLVFVGILLISLVILMLVSYLTGPIKALTVMANQIASDDEVELIPVRGHDEIADLTRSLTSMYKSLQSRDEKIRRSNRELQKEIAERNSSEAALLENNEMWSAIADGSSEAIYVKNVDGCFTFMNKAGSQFIGRSVEEVIGKKISELLPSDLAGRIEKAEREMLASGENIIEEMIVPVDGVQRTFLVSKGVYFDSKGEAKGIFGVDHDITVLAERQANLEAARAAAESANLAKSQFLANMSHEIRTPMNAIIGMTKLTLDTRLSDEQRGYLQTVQEASSSLLGLLNDILDFSKIEADQIDLEEQSFDLIENVEQTVRILVEKASDKGLDLLVDIPASLPRIVLGDKMRLRQILFNLVGNSIKFTEKGYVCISCRVESRVGNVLKLHFMVEDTGVGIALEKQAAIFDRFTQADNSITRLYGGTGLGLPISRKLVELMGGEIWLESTLGEGSIFHFTAGFKPEQTDLSHDNPFCQDQTEISVLLIDRHHKQRQIVKGILESWFFSVSEYSDWSAGRDAIRQSYAEQNPFKLIVIDQDMTSSKAASLLSELNQQIDPQQTQVIFLTAKINPLLCKDYKSHISTFCLLKPITCNNLQLLMSQVLNGVTCTMVASERVLNTEVITCEHSDSTLNILLVDDNVFNRELAKTVLEKGGHNVSLAGNGIEALELLGCKNFDLVFMDVQMPEMDGHQTTRLIRQCEQGGAEKGKYGDLLELITLRLEGRHLPIIAMTAHAMTGDKEECLKSGMDDYLTKPFQTEDVFNAIKKVVSQSQ